MFPNLRLRRLRMKGSLRNLFQEVRVSKSDLVQVIPASGGQQEELLQSAIKERIGGVYFKNWKGLENANSIQELVKIVELHSDEENVAIEAAHKGADILVVDGTAAAGRVRKVLDDKNLTNVVIAVSLPANSSETDCESADFFFIKGGLKSIDLLSSFNDKNHRPVASIQPTIEADMLKTSFDNGWLSREAVISEYVVSMKRSGARFVTTPFALEAAKLISSC